MSVTLRDGRKVELQEYGDPNGAPALWFHGAGASRLQPAVLDLPARELGLRIISLDRPGCGGSDPLPGRTVLDYAADVIEVLDALGLDKVAVGGQSAGGMYAMAFGSAHPERTVRIVPVNPSSPATDPAARAALSRSARTAYALLRRRPQLAIKQVMRTTPPGRFAAALARRSNPDSHLLDDPAIAALSAADTAEVRRQPNSGYLESELAIAGSAWGFDHRAVAAPVALVSGEKDGGYGYATVWAQELPQGRFVVVPGGHVGFYAPDVARRIAELLAGRD